MSFDGSKFKTFSAQISCCSDITLIQNFIINQLFHPWDGFYMCKKFIFEKQSVKHVYQVWKFDGCSKTFRPYYWTRHLLMEYDNCSIKKKWFCWRGIALFSPNKTKWFWSRSVHLCQHSARMCKNGCLWTGYSHPLKNNWKGISV